MTINAGLSADEYIASGDEALQSGDATTAITYYTMAINHHQRGDSTNQVYAKRSTAHLQTNNPHGALEDATAALRISESSKAYVCKASALFSLELYEDSIKSYKEGLSKFPEDDELKQGLGLVEQAVVNQKGGLEDWGAVETSLPLSVPVEATAVNIEEEATPEPDNHHIPSIIVEPELLPEVEKVSTENVDEESVIQTEMTNSAKVQNTSLAPPQLPAKVEEPAPAPPIQNPGLWKLTGRKIREYKVGATVLDGIRDGMDAVQKQVQPEVSTRAAVGDPKSQQAAPPNPGLWKLTGRKIRQYKVGATVLDGIRDGMDVTSRSVQSGIDGVKKKTRRHEGSLALAFDNLQVYQQHGKMKGHIDLALTEPVEASSLIITIQATRKVIPREGHPKTDTVCRETYQIDGGRVFDHEEKIAFELIVPQAEKKGYEHTGTSAFLLDMFGKGTDQTPLVWSIWASLDSPGGSWISIHSPTTRIHVAD